MKLTFRHKRKKDLPFFYLVALNQHIDYGLMIQILYTYCMYDIAFILEYLKPHNWKR